MYRKLISSLLVFSLIISLFGNVAFAQDETRIEKPELNKQVQQELENSLGAEQAENFSSEVLYDRSEEATVVEIENTTDEASLLKSEVKIDSDNNLEIKVNYFDDNNNEIEGMYEVLPVFYSKDELIADVIDIKTGETYRLDTKEMNASVVPIVIAHIIRVGVSAAVGLVGRALIKSAVKKLAFRSQKLLDIHYDKHVIKQGEYGSITKHQYLEKAQDIIGSDSPNVISKKRSDGSRVFYNKSTNDFVVLSKDGYIQTLFKPTNGINYYNRQN